MEKQKTQRINGVEYVYIDTPYWDSEKKRGAHKRTYIGKNVDGVFVPNKSYKLKQELHFIGSEETLPRKTGPVPAAECKRLFYGSTYLLSEIADKIGITADLKSCFPLLYEQFLSFIFYLVLEEGQPAYRFHKWSNTHMHPYGEDIPSQRVSEMFGCITEDAKMAYFQKQAGRRREKEYLAFDTTSISTYSALIKQARYGKNKEGDSLPQINLMLLYGEESMLPVYFRKLPGNISDVRTIENLIKDIDFLDLTKLKLVMDRGFYSEKNINDLFKHHHKFLIGAKMNIRIVSDKLDKIRDDFDSHNYYNSESHLYIQSFTPEWDYTEEKPRSGKVIEEKRRIYVHYYYNDQKATDEKDHLNHLLDKLEKEIVTGDRKAEHDKEYAKYFTFHETPVRGLTYSFNEDAIRKAKKNFGYFTLISNDIKDPVLALQIYRARDLIEKSFGNLKERLNMRRMSVSSEENFEGKLFIQFVALELLSYIKKKMDDEKLFRDYTIQSLLDELDVIEYYQQPGKAHHLSEITEKQKHLYEKLGVSCPS